MNLRQILILGGVVLWSAHCAKQGFPPGGPEDKTPPTVVVTIPQRDSTRVESLKAITIRFSEPMDRPSVEEAIFICPRLEKEATFTWQKNELSIRLAETLAKDVTYIVTIGATARDIRYNQLAFSYTFAFATGDSIQQGRIRGTTSLADGTMANALIWAWVMPGTTLLDPTAVKPDYITQSNEKGEYTLDYLSPGSYRVFALVDKNRDGELSAGIDQLGIPVRDLAIMDTVREITGHDFRLAPYDTMRVSALSAEALDQHHVMVRFGGMVDNQTMREVSLYRMVDTVTEESLEEN
jgi:hypothetical protein